MKKTKKTIKSPTAIAILNFKQCMNEVTCWLLGHVDLEIESSDPDIYNCCQRCGRILW